MKITFRRDFFNCFKANKEFLLLPCLKIDWYYGIGIHGGFLCWRFFLEWENKKSGKL